MFLGILILVVAVVRVETFRDNLSYETNLEIGC